MEPETADSDQVSVQSVQGTVEKNSERTEKEEEKLRIARENREKRRKLREKNKKRKRLEEVSEDEDDQKEADSKKQKIEKENKNGIWVGNLSFSTSSELIRKHFTDCGEITRIKCPKGNDSGKLNKGIAFVFFSSPEAVVKGIAKSEQKLDGRALLIKDANDYSRKDGQEPAVRGSLKDAAKKKNPPCPTLFVGNLSFEATREELQGLFEWAGDIRKVRLATFEDSGKCKGFAYIDYQTVESATKAIRAPDKHTLNGRKLRVEFGSEEAHMRGKPWLMREKKKSEIEDTQKGSTKKSTEKKDAEQEAEQEAEEPRQPKEHDAEQKREGWRPRKPKTDGTEGDKRKKMPQGRVKSGQALSQAQRQKPSVQEFKGTKIVFDE